jgi:hypothetical protein
MTTFSDVQAEKEFGAILAKADADGEVRIRRGDGKEFILRPAMRSPLDVGHISLDPPMTADEIVQAVREGRERR